MAVQSMTGFSRREGVSGRTRWAWELRSVNGKGLDLRLRLPPGLDGLEAELRRLAGELLTRGNLQASLTLATEEAKLEAVLNREALAAVLALKADLGASIDPAPLRFDTLLSIKGLVELREPEESAEAVAARDAAIVDGFAAALADLVAMREREGAALAAVLLAQIERIAALAASVEADPSRSPEEIRRRLEVQVAQLVEMASTLDRDRLHGEAALLAASCFPRAGRLAASWIFSPRNSTARATRSVPSPMPRASPPPASR
jgi:uncharacterized protein (TIGR00255 family)